jgi:glycerophosphoryl diester phosphodiesterase
MRRLLLPVASLLTVAATTAPSLVLAGPAEAASRPERHGDAVRVAEPLVIAHRGASGYRPEHTLAAYRLAIRQGADYVEPDLVSTKDGVLVARHENEISGTTDVADRPEFAARKTVKVVDGVPLEGWFTEDFTVAELRTLRAVERIPDLRPRNTRFDGRYRVPTLQQVIDLVRRESARAGRPVGIYPETKHPTYFDSVGLSLEEPLVRTLRANKLDRPRAHVFIQSFETTNLRELDRVVRMPLVQLFGNKATAPYDLVAAGTPRTYGELASPAGLAEIATYADGVGPEKGYVIPRNADGTLGEPTTFVDDAHDAGLLVHAYTFRAENFFLPTDYRSGSDPAAYGDYAGEVTAFLAAGLDGLFADHPDQAVAARDEFVEARGVRAAS